MGATNDQARADGGSDRRAGRERPVATDGGTVTEGGGSDDEADETSPAESFGLRIGVPLAVIAVAWAFVGPAHLLETGRYEWPIVASLVEPLPVTFFGYIAGIVFLFAFVGSLLFPSRTDEPQAEYASDLAINLLIPTVAVVVLMIGLGYLIPAVQYLIDGAIVDAGLIVVGIVVVAVLAAIFNTIVVLVLALVSAPLWVPSFAGAYGGSVVRGLMG